MATTETNVAATSAITKSTADDERLKAEARAYALSTTKPSSSSSSTTTKSSSAAATAASSSTSNKRKASSQSNRASKVRHTSSVSNPSTARGSARSRAALPLHTTNAPLAGPPGGMECSFSNNFQDDPEHDDYIRFVRSLGLDDTMLAGEDDEDFNLSDIDDDDDDTDDGPSVDSIPKLSSPITMADLPEWDNHLEDELGSLLEEDLQAAVTTLMGSKKPPCSPSPTVTTPSSKSTKMAPGATPSPTPATPLRDAARQSSQTQVTYAQSQQLRKLMARHYQLLIQQAILAVRAAQGQKSHRDRNDFMCGETADDLAEILDGAVGMLQDLDQNRKDAIRYSIQLESTKPPASSGRRSLLAQFAESEQEERQQQQQLSQNVVGSLERRLTRSAFSRTLQQHGCSRRTTFDIPGLTKLNETFATIDKSVDGVRSLFNVLEISSHAEACRTLLRQAGANIDDQWLPGTRDLSEVFVNPTEYLGKDFIAPMSEDQKLLIRRNRNLFTSGEDNLVLRGVNLYGEKQWILIADRYLPDRSVNIISQRYNKLCVMLYKAHGVYIDEKGNLKAPPKLESVDEIDDAKVAQLKPVAQPAILNVHRWSLEEDLTLLKAVPLMGHFWAELGFRLIGHRDRGHLRKRYQVLERRVKATMTRMAKNDATKGGSKSTSKTPAAKAGNTLKKATPASSKAPPVPSKSKPKAVATKTPVSAPAPTKSATTITGTKTAATATATATTKETSIAASTAMASKKISSPMSIEKAAASLAYLRPPHDDTAKNTKPTKKAPSAKSAKAVPKKLALASQPKPANKGPIITNIPSNTSSKKKKSVTPRKPPASVSPLSETPSKLSVDLDLDLDTGSRAAVEQLVSENSQDCWSQLSRMKKMFDNDNESYMVADAMDQLSKTPGPQPSSTTITKLPQLQLDNNSSSGLSLFGGDVSQLCVDSSNPALSSSLSITGGIMARVMDGASKFEGSKNAQHHKSDDPVDTNKVPFNSIAQHNQSTSLLPPPESPKRQTLYGTDGICMSFDASSKLSHNNVHLSPNQSSALFYSLNGGHTTDGFEFCNFEISDRSRQELERKEAALLPRVEPPDNNHSLLGTSNLMSADLEVISTLSNLGSSNAGTPPDPPTDPVPAPPPSNSKSSNPRRKSLFLSVVGEK